MTTRDESGRSIDDAQDALHDAMRASDAATLGKLLHEGLTFELPDGSLINRATDLNAYASGEVQYERLGEVHRVAREHAGRARVDSLIDVVMTNGGRRTQGRLSYRRYWAIIDGRWQVLAGNAERAE